MSGNEPDRTSKDFTLAEMEWARAEGYEFGVQSAISIISAGGTVETLQEMLDTYRRDRVQRP